MSFAPYYYWHWLFALLNIEYIIKHACQGWETGKKGQEPKKLLIASDSNDLLMSKANHMECGNSQCRA
ncbi:MAG: hypothetical protein A2X48_00100 [Lentisphaerae bacterium GWF2_49_21]|nr:MAG: hypothetical protein A2X48_00100 [Lentisphaerae bacterium GWF2_49_21]